MHQLSLKQRIYRKICYLFGRLLPDAVYLKMMYQVNMGKKLNLKNPVTYNEKLNWLKLYDRKTIYTKWQISMRYVILSAENWEKNF